MEKAQSRGLGVNAWTVPDRQSVLELARAGVDGVIVDDDSIVPEI
ncbi:MAG: glycerophosphodiester phosphodiesterase family protein [Halodesulfurarchaeum sp.]